MALGSLWLLLTLIYLSHTFPENNISHCVPEIISFLILIINFPCHWFSKEQKSKKRKSMKNAVEGLAGLGI